MPAIVEADDLGMYVVKFRGAGQGLLALVAELVAGEIGRALGLRVPELVFAEVDAACNVNVSRFGDRIIGPGGFINISQNAKTIVFSGTFTAGGLAIDWPDGSTRIAKEGAEKKFVRDVQQVTYSGPLAAQNGQRALYVTERAVFRRNGRGRLELIEIAPGIDLERDIFGQMEFRPDVAADLKETDPRIFRPEPMGLAATIAQNPRLVRSARLEQFLKGGLH